MMYYFSFLDVQKTKREIVQRHLENITNRVHKTIVLRIKLWCMVAGIWALSF